MVNEPSAYARNLFTFLMQQNSDFFADPRHIKLQTPEARRVIAALQADLRRGADHQEPGLHGGDRADS